MHGNDTVALTCYGKTLILLPSTPAFITNLLVKIGVNFVLTLFILLLNCPVCYIMLTRRKYRKPSYSLLLNNVIADLILGVLLCVWSVILFFIFMYKESSCTFALPIIFFTTVSGNAIAIIGNVLAVDRYLAIFQPFLYDIKISHNNRIYVLPLIAAWLFSLVVSVLGYIESTCKLVFFIIIFAVTCIWCCFVYLKIFFLVREKKRMETASQNVEAGAAIIRPHYKKKDLKLFVLTIVVLITFFLCYGPWNILLITFLQTDQDSITSGFIVALIWSKTLYHFKGVLNPLIYCYSMKEIRNDLSACFLRHNAISPTGHEVPIS